MSDSDNFPVWPVLATVAATALLVFALTMSVGVWPPVFAHRATCEYALRAATASDSLTLARKPYNCNIEVRQ